VQISINLNASTMMIADKVSDLIRGRTALEAVVVGSIHWPAARTHIGAFATCRRIPRLSADRGRPEVSGALST
jgi:hypothetical protein